MTERNLYRRNYQDDEDVVNLSEEENQINREQPQNPEEASFKKRYGDLRSYLHQKEQKWEEEKRKLLEQVEAASRQNTVIPQNKEELEQWLEQYPKVGNIIRTLAAEEAEKLGKKISEIEAKNEEERKKNLKERAMIQLSKLHPDFYESKDGRPPIVQQQEFHDWIEEQEHQGVNQAREALYDNETNAALAAKWITLFKTETNYYGKKVKKGNPQEGAAATIRGGSSVAPKSSTGTFTFSESQVEKMSEREYAKYADAIDEAIRTGTFLYDRTGAAQ